MGKTTAKVKNRYNAKAYDRIAVCIKKGKKEIISARARALGLSLNAYIMELIKRDMAEADNRNNSKSEPNGKN
jgi:predicted HicB family RNase H-like nuclease